MIRPNIWTLPLILILHMSGPSAPAGQEPIRRERSPAPGVRSSRPIATRARGIIAARSPLTVVCLGDSVTGVYYHTGSRRAYSDMLAIALRKAKPEGTIAVINAGISGHTTRDALARLDRDVLQRRPDLVTVMFGLNDVTRVPLAEYRKNLGTIVARCRESGSEVILCTPNNVIDTPGRTSDRLRSYCDAVREVGRDLALPVADTFADFDVIRDRSPADWRLLMSDEFHPNMAGHRRIAELLAETITGLPIKLPDVPPPTPVLRRVAERVRAGQPVRVLAMPPCDAWIGPALKAVDKAARVEITTWPTGGKTLAQLEADASKRVRPMAPDLVIIAVPRGAKSDSTEKFIHDYTWIMNNALSFGEGGWDCVVIHPAVLAPSESPSQQADDLIRRLVSSQDLTLIDRPRGDLRGGLELFTGWIQTHARELAH